MYYVTHYLLPNKPWNALIRAEAERRFALAAVYHFPADADGWVRPGSGAAWSMVADATDRKSKHFGDIELFGKGLHRLQDSWSHQGLPPLCPLSVVGSMGWDTGGRWNWRATGWCPTTS